MQIRSSPRVTCNRTSAYRTRITSIRELIDVDEPLAIEAAPELLLSEAAPELSALYAPPELLPLEAPPELRTLEAPQELLDIEPAPTEQELRAIEAPDELMTIEAPQGLLVLKVPPLEPEAIMINQVDKLLPQLPPPSMKFPVSNNSRALPSSTKLLALASSENNELTVALPTQNKQKRLILK